MLGSGEQFLLELAAAMSRLKNSSLLGKKRWKMNP
ncbi:Uncharacterised protein [Klebsiella pneumoniae]|nr:Uncharacterised protein [Klebsiella pneumoniae]